MFRFVTLRHILPVLLISLLTIFLSLVIFLIETSQTSSAEAHSQATFISPLSPLPPPPPFLPPPVFEDPPPMAEDSTPPDTLAELQGTLGNNDWYISPVKIFLTALDDLAGVEFTAYRLDSSEKAVYSTPFEVGTEQNHILEFYSGDKIGNTEETQQVGLKIDLTPPVVTILEPQLVEYTRCQTATVRYTASDAISGLATLTAAVDGQPTTDGTALDLLMLALGQHTLAVTATDQAGWVTTESVTFTMTATLEGLVCAKHRFHALGEIHGPGAAGLVNSLDAKLEAAIQAREQGQLNAATNQLKAFINQVQAQQGKKISPPAASVLIGDAQDIINQWQ